MPLAAFIDSPVSGAHTSISMYKRRSVFKGYPNLDDPDFFENVMSVIQALAQDGIPLEMMSDETSEVTMLHQMTWNDPQDNATELALVRDLHDEICYATIQSKQSWISKRARELFNTRFECYTIDELVKACQRRFFEPNLLIALGLLGRKPDGEMIKTIAQALDHDLPKVRYCAARAAAFTQWSAFVPDLEMMLKMENDQTARDMAEHALQACLRHGT